MQKRRKTDLPPALRERMKKAFAEVQKAVMACEDETGRKRCDLFKELPNKRVRIWRPYAVYHG
jgi:ATP-dependent helicase STH1/SNF2